MERKIVHIVFDLSDSRRGYLIKLCTLELIKLIRREGGKATTTIRFEKVSSNEYGEDTGLLYALYSLDLPAYWFVALSQEDADNFYLGGRRASRAWETVLHKGRIIGDTDWK